jgi:seryl-tRNA synthetase
MTDKNQLKQFINDFITLNKEEEMYKEKMKNLKNKKDKIHDTIINYMSNNDILDKEIIFENNKIKCGSSKTTESITKKLIFERLKQFLKDENLATQATNHIYSDRNSSQKLVLKILDLKK